MRCALGSFSACVVHAALIASSVSVVQAQTSEQPVSIEQPAGAAPQEQAPLMAEQSSSLRIDTYAWIWLLHMSGDIGVRDRSAEVNADFVDILDASDSIFAFSGRLEVGSGRFAGFVDGLYSDLGADDQTGPVGVANVDIRLEQAILDFGLMYRVVDVEPSGDGAANARNLTLDLYAGGRYSAIEVTIDPALIASRSRSTDWVDPIIGAKLGLPLAERWRIELNGDIGGFGLESDLTWSATAVFGFDFKLFGLPASALAGYRAIGWDYSEGTGADEFTFDIVQHGPILGLTIRF
jgi:hypothetical protein